MSTFADPPGGCWPAWERPGARPALAVAGHDMRARWWHPLHDGRNCQNWGISKGREMDHLTDAASPERMAEAARASGALSVVFAYNAARLRPAAHSGTGGGPVPPDLIARDSGQGDDPWT